MVYASQAVCYRTPCQSRWRQGYRCLCCAGRACSRFKRGSVCHDQGRAHRPQASLIAGRVCDLRRCGNHRVCQLTPEQCDVLTVGDNTLKQIERSRLSDDTQKQQQQDAGRQQRDHAHNGHTARVRALRAAKQSQYQRPGHAARRQRGRLRDCVCADDDPIDDPIGHRSLSPVWAGSNGSEHAAHRMKSPHAHTPLMRQVAATPPVVACARSPWQFPAIVRSSDVDPHWSDTPAPDPVRSAPAPHRCTR